MELSKNNKSNKSNKSKRAARKRFVSVDVWQSKFGPVSERAIYDVYSQRFKVQLYNMKNYSFFHCVKALRELGDPTLGTPPQE